MIIQRSPQSKKRCCLSPGNQDVVPDIPIQLCSGHAAVQNQAHRYRDVWCTCTCFIGHIYFIFIFYIFFPSFGFFFNDFFDANLNWQVFSYHLINPIDGKGKGAEPTADMYRFRTFCSNIRSTSFLLTYIQPTKMSDTALEDKGRVHSKYSGQQQPVLCNDFL